MLPSIIAGIPADTYKVDAIRGYNRPILKSDVPAIIESIHADTYKVDALNEMLSRGCFDPQDSANVIRTISADTYVVDAISAIVSHYPVLPASVAWQLFDQINADTYKVDSLDSLSSSLSSNQVVIVIQSIRADAYRMDALKKLAHKIDGKDVIELLSLFSPSYQSDAIEFLQPLVRDDDVVAFTSFAEKVKSQQKQNMGIYIGGATNHNIMIGDIIENNMDYGRFLSQIMGNPVHPSLRDVYQNLQPKVEPKLEPAKRFEYPDKLDDDTKVKEDDEKDVCAVCADYYHRTINLPCMHACLCFHCAKVIGESEKKLCPVCRTPLGAIKTVFKS